MAYRVAFYDICRASVLLEHDLCICMLITPMRWFFANANLTHLARVLPQECSRTKKRKDRSDLDVVLLVKVFLPIVSLCEETTALGKVTYNRTISFVSFVAVAYQHQGTPESFRVVGINDTLHCFPVSSAGHRKTI
eukprot:SAG31_NODE_116_length_24094_cov_38.884184_4_plen_136_part_00